MKCVNSLALRVLVAVGFLFTMQPVIAHHSFAGFSNDEVREFTGTIKEFQFRNPHVWIQILTTNAEGQEEEWSIEWGSPNQLGRRGIRPATFPPGAEVTVRFHPMINGSAAGGFVGAQFCHAEPGSRCPDAGQRVRRSFSRPSILNTTQVSE